MTQLLTIAAGFLLILLESVFLRVFGVRVLAPQIAVLLVVYVGFRRDFDQAALATLLFSAVADICSGGPAGYHALGLTAAFFATALVALRWRPRSLVSTALATIPAVLASDLVALVAMALFRPGSIKLSLWLTVTPLAAIVTALLALPLLWLVARVDRAGGERRQPATASL